MLSTVCTVMSVAPHHLMLQVCEHERWHPENIVTCGRTAFECDVNWPEQAHIRIHKPFGAGIIFLILAHPVYKMRIIQEPNSLDL